MTYPKFCAECKHSKPNPTSEWELKCHHPIVNANDPWALSHTKAMYGSSCCDERSKINYFHPIGLTCGKSGKLWEPK